MGKFIDLSGQRFGRLTVIKRDGKDKSRKALWLCICDCGNMVTVTGNRLRSGVTKSCGCLSIDESKKRFVTHGKRQTKLYKTWANMKQRCYNKRNHRYNNYGGRGITVCDEWKNNFENFYNWALSHGYKDGLSIDRIDVNGNYCPENCRWATSSQQANNKTSNHYEVLHGEKHTLREWETITGINQSTIKMRLRKGYPIERALTEPVKKES